MRLKAPAGRSRHSSSVIPAHSHVWRSRFLSLVVWSRVRWSDRLGGLTVKAAARPKAGRKRVYPPSEETFPLT